MFRLLTCGQLLSRAIERRDLTKVAPCLYYIPLLWRLVRPQGAEMVLDAPSSSQPIPALTAAQGCPSSDS